MVNFMDAMRAVSAGGGLGRTENGAIGYRTSGKRLLDMNFAVSSYRNRSEEEIFNDFMKVVAENPKYAFTWLFYCRDIRGGMGERRFFRAVMSRLATAEDHAQLMIRLLSLFGEYGRWDDMLVLLDNCCEPVAARIFDIVKEQLTQDCEAMKQGKSCSLLAKWMPSENTSSTTTVRRALKLAEGLGLPRTEYRKMLTQLRSHVRVVERYMSSNRWGDIAYDQVPSKANLLYKDAFMKHDPVRRREFLDRAVSGDTKINSAAAFPHDIVARYNINIGQDDSLESMWKNLPNVIEHPARTLVVRDGSGSMTARIMGTQTRAIDVSTALSIYFAERCTGPFHNQFITFAANPKIVNLSGYLSLRDRLYYCSRFVDWTNTNIEAVFNLILETAVSTDCPQEDLPETVLIVSDMEFDAMAGRANMSPLFNRIRKRFQEHGYQLPKLAFWNVMSRTNVIPIKENENGVVLVSGFSPAAIRMVLQEETDPYDALMAILNGERYAPVRNAMDAFLTEQ